MTAAVKNIIIEQKATFQKRLTYRDKSKKPINLTGFGAAMQIRDSAGVLIADLSTRNGKIILGGATGTIDITISADETSLMTFNTALYDLKLEIGAIEMRLMQGKVTLSLGQTA